jgi:hypothetical protein
VRIVFKIDQRVDTDFVVGFSRARSIAQATVPRWSQPYASTPIVWPEKRFKLHGFCIDLSNGKSPSGLSIPGHRKSIRHSPDIPMVTALVHAIECKQACVVTRMYVPYLLMHRQRLRTSLVATSRDGANYREAEAKWIRK